jgi:HK97 family phage portal protein
MGLFTDITNYFRPRFHEKNSQSIAFTDTGFFESLGLSRRNTRIRYDKDSAFTAYRSHELVFACINKIADVMNDAEIVVEVKNAKGTWEPKPGHLLPALFKRPNNNQTGRDVRKLMVQSEQGLGRFYAHIERSGAGIPVAMTVLNPNRIMPKYDRTQSEILFYEYTTKNGRRIEIKPEDLFIRRRPDLLDQFNGFAPLGAALKSINSDLGLTDYVDAFFESDGTPSGILKILNASVTDTKREELQAKWKQKYSRGGANQKGLAVLDQNADYQKIGSNLDELASDSLSGRFESRICAVFGVPPNLVGAYVGLMHVTANATAKAELQNFWDNKISGELAVMREWLTWFVLPEFEDIEAIKAEQIRVGWDISHVAFLQEDVEKLHLRARDNFKAGGWTLNEFRQATGMTPDPAGDYYIQPINVTALSPENRAIEAAQKVPAGTDPNVTPEPAPPKALPEHPEKKTFDLDGLTLGREPRGVELVIDLKKINTDYESQKETAIKILQKFRIDLIGQAVTTLDKLNSQTAHTLTLTPDPKLRKEIAKAVRSAYIAGRSQIMQEITAQNAAKHCNTADFKADDPLTYLEYLDELIDGMVSRIINEITGRAINEYLTLKLLLDYTIEKLKENLTGQSEKFIDPIAGSSVNAAISRGRSDEIEANADKIDHIEYSAVLDANTCGPCGDADGEVASDEADLPAAPNPDCDGGDRCRCIHVAVVV